MSIAIDGQTALPNENLKVRPGTHSVLCTATGFNPNSTEINMQLLGDQEQTVTKTTVEIDTDGSAAVKADRYRLLKEDLIIAYIYCSRVYFLH